MTKGDFKLSMRTQILHDVYSKLNQKIATLKATNFRLLKENAELKRRKSK